jgi:hypothetical protein
VLDKGNHFTSPLIRHIVDPNYLHYSIVMFLACTAILIGVSMLYPAPTSEKLAGLTFATLQGKLDTTELHPARLARETRLERTANVIFTIVLGAVVIGLYYHFR